MARLTTRAALTSTDALLAVEGELIATTADQFRAAARRSLGAAPERIVVDLRAVTYCDAQGVAALDRLRRDANQVGTRVALTNVDDWLARVFHSAGLANFDRADGDPSR